jgi:hypothetical protein
LKAKPAFTAIAVLSLGLAIGANTAMFTLVNDVIFRRPPLERPEELVDIYGSGQEVEFNVLSEPDARDIGREVKAFAGVAGSKFTLVPYEAGGGVARVAAELVSPNYFEVLGLKATHGRVIVPEDAPAPGEGAVVVLSDRFWRRFMGADRAVLGTSLRISGASYTIIGVVAPEYLGRIRGVPTDLFFPVTLVNQIDRSPSDQLEDRDTLLRGLSSRRVSSRTPPSSKRRWSSTAWLPISGPVTSANGSKGLAFEWFPLPT